MANIGRKWLSSGQKTGPERGQIWPLYRLRPMSPKVGEARTNLGREDVSGKSAAHGRHRIRKNIIRNDVQVTRYVVLCCRLAQGNCDTDAVSDVCAGVLLCGSLLVLMAPRRLSWHGHGEADDGRENQETMKWFGELLATSSDK